MKKSLVSLGVFILISINIFGQNVVSSRTTDTLVGGGPYSLQGDAILELLDNGNYRFRLDDDYMTDNGPDVQIFLTNNSQFSSPIDISNTLFIEDIGSDQGGISKFSGAFTKDISSGITSLSDYDYVVFVCVRFGNLYWGSGNLGPIVNELITSTNNLVENNNTLIFYPNPTKNLLRFNRTQQFVQVYDLTGKLMLEKTKITELITTDLNTGSYLIIADGKRSKFQVIN